jgi:hypothetical protein
MASLRVSSPSAAAAFVLVELLASHGATANCDGDGEWQVDVPLDGAASGLVPTALAATREWLELCDLPAAAVRLDGHTHVLNGSRKVIRANPEPVH